MRSSGYDDLLEEVSDLYNELGIYAEVADEILRRYPDRTRNTSRKSLGITLRRLLDRNSHKSLREEVTTPHSVPFGQVTHYWDKTKNISAFIKISPADQIGIEERIENVVDKFVKGSKPFKIYKRDTEKALIGTVTDEHIGMNPNPDGKGLFNYEYNAQIYTEKLELYFNSLVQQRDIHGNFEVLYLDNLGDREDGFNGFTTRGGQ